MLTNIGTITVQVTDQDKALAFYTQQLGFEKRSEAADCFTSEGCWWRRTEDSHLLR